GRLLIRRPYGRTHRFYLVFPNDDESLGLGTGKQKTAAAIVFEIGDASVGRQGRADQPRFQPFAGFVNGPDIRTVEQQRFGHTVIPKKRMVALTGVAKGQTLQRYGVSFPGVGVEPEKTMTRVEQKKGRIETAD